MECVIFNELIKRIEVLEEEIKTLKGENQSAWMDLDEVCKRYHLPKHNLKDRKWRLENHFPTYQDGPYCSLFFHSRSVEEWINEHLYKQR